MRLELTVSSEEFNDLSDLAQKYNKEVAGGYSFSVITYNGWMTGSLTITLDPDFEQLEIEFLGDMCEILNSHRKPSL